MKKLQQQKSTKQYWFKAKTYGWGWYPASWQGVIITLTAIVLVLFSDLYVPNQWVSIAVIVGILGLFVWIAYKTGEKPGWRWGK